MSQAYALRGGCVECGSPAERGCRRCGVPLCEDHAAVPPAGVCGSCARVLARRVGQDQLVRVVGATGAAVGGMVGGALVTMVLAGLLGIAPELIILLVLLVEVVCGGMAAYAADRRIQGWLDERTERALSGLPEARLLAGEARPPASASAPAPAPASDGDQGPGSA